MNRSRWVTLAALAALAAFSAAWALPASAADAPPSAAAPAPPASPSAASASSAEPATAEASLLQISDRLSDEAERQHQVNQRMDVAIERFVAIVRDLQSNGLLRQGGGPQLDRFVQVLKILSGRHVPDAAKYLEEARKQLAALRPNLVAADKEIEIIIKELDRLLRAAPGQGDDLLRELEVIIQDEKRTHQETKQWGAQLLQNPEAAEKPRREIAAAQDRIARRTESFMERLRQARDAENDPLRHQKMLKAHEVLDQNKVPKLLSTASKEVEEKKPVAATADQLEAIRWLEEAAKLLRSDDQTSDYQAMKELRDRLENILKEQVELRETTEQVPAEKFPDRKNDLQVRERAIDKEVNEARKDVPQAASPEVKTNLDKADQHMQKAENQMAATQQQPAVEAQKEAEKSLQDAIKALDQDIAKMEQAWQDQTQPMQSLADLAQKAMDLAEKQRELREQTSQTPKSQLPQLTQPEQNLQQQAQELNQQLPMPQFQQAAQEMQNAAQDLQQSQQQPAMDHQEAAEKALMNAAQALQQAQAAMELAAQQMQLMRQTAQTPQGELPQLVPPQQSLQQQAETAQFHEAAQDMQQAAQDLQQAQGQEAQQHQQAAIDALMHQAAEAMGMPEPGQPHPGQPHPGQVAIPMPTPRTMPTQTPQPREMGLRDFGRGGATNQRAPRGDDHWRILGDRERDSLYQKYVRQLPPEYRELLGDYYEALSKEAPRVRPKTSPAAPAAAPPAGTEGKP